MSDVAFQDLLAGNHCWGCGPDAKDGLKLRSYWDGDETVCTWMPRPEFAAGPRHILYGGMIGSVIDCHSIWTAIAEAYKARGARDRLRAGHLVRDGVAARHLPEADADRSAVDDACTGDGDGAA